MYNFVNTGLGWFHLGSSIVAMIFGAYILFSKKGTLRHKQIGYGYVFSMLAVCFSALGIYNLTGKFGIFHILAFVGLATLIAGMIPMLSQQLKKSYGTYHLWFMYYSVLGLYAAFVSELSVRIPEKPFFLMVAIASGGIYMVGSAFIIWKEKHWNNFFLPREL